MIPEYWEKDVAMEDEKRKTWEAVYGYIVREDVQVAGVKEEDAEVWRDQERELDSENEVQLHMSENMLLLQQAAEKCRTRFSLLL